MCNFMVCLHLFCFHLSNKKHTEAVFSLARHQVRHSVKMLSQTVAHTSSLLRKTQTVWFSSCSDLQPRLRTNTKNVLHRKTKSQSSLEGAYPAAQQVCVCVCVLKAMRDPWDSPVAGLQTGWHPQSSFFILETAVVSVTTRLANEWVGGEGGGRGCWPVCVCVSGHIKWQESSKVRFWRLLYIITQTV